MGRSNRTERRLVERIGALRARWPSSHHHLQPSRGVERHQHRRAQRSERGVRPIPRRRDAWVAIVTGEGRAFCVGADMNDMAGSSGDFAGTFWEKPTLNSFESGWEIFKPVIAAVNGYCLGYGLTLVTWCDFVIASDRAEFGFPEVRLGVPAIVGSIRLPQRVGWQYAMELLLTGERIDAATGPGHRPCRLGRPPRRAHGRGPATGRSPGGVPLPSPPGPPRRSRTVARNFLSSTPSDSARQCARWLRPPTTRPRVGSLHRRDARRAGRVADQLSRVTSPLAVPTRGRPR